MTLKHFHLACLALLCIALLAACGEEVTAPLSQTPILSPIATPAGVQVQPAAGDSTASLKQALIADNVLVNSIMIVPGTPVVETIDYRFNDKGMQGSQVGADTEIVMENDRVVRAVSKHVVEQVKAGTPIDQVVLYMHLATNDVPAIWRINVTDMQDWSAGKLTDEAYRQRWCCNVRADLPGRLLPILRRACRIMAILRPSNNPPRPLARDASGPCE